MKTNILFLQEIKINNLLRILVFSFVILNNTQSLCAQGLRNDAAGIYNSFADGKDVEFAKSICNYVERNPLENETYFYINTLVDVASLISPEKALSVLSKVINAKPGSQAQNEIIRRANICRDYIEYTYRKGPADEFNRKYFPVRQWKMQGPFYKYGTGDFNYKYVPELNPDIWRDKKTLIINVKNLEGFVIPSYYKYGDHGIVYMATTIDLDVPSLLYIESDEDFIVFINQKPVIYNLKGEEKLKERIVRINSAGKYNVVIKTSLNGSGFRISKEDAIEFGEIRHLQNVEEQVSAVYRELLNKPDSSDKSLKLARWFEGQNNEKSFKYYREAYEKTKNPVIDYMYADALIRIGEKQKLSSIAEKGWEKVKIISQKNDIFIMVKIRYLEYLITHEEYDQVPGYISKINSKARNSLLYNRLKLLFYETHDVDRYEEVLDESINQFPFSSDLLYSGAESLQFRNPEKSITLCKNILSREKNVKTVLLLSEILRRSGDLNKTNLFDEVEADNEEGLFKHVAYLIASDKYSEARTILIKEAARKDDPKTYEMLGRVASLEGKNADLYWEKASSMVPPNSFPFDYLNYKGKDSPFSLVKYTDSEKADSIIHNYLSGKKYDENILLRRFVHLIYPYDSGALLCEEIVNIRSDDDIKKAKKYRIPFPENVRIIKAEIISEKGEFISSYDVHKVNGEHYITLNDLHVNSLVHVMYVVNCYLPRFFDSDIIDYGTKFVNSYNETIYSVEIVIVSGRKDIQVQQSSNILRVDNVLDGISTITLSANNIHSESSRNVLEWYSIASTEGIGGFTTWLRGAIRTAGKPDFNNCNLDSENDIYGYVLKDLELDDHNSFQIRNLQEVINLRKGTELEKILITQELLKHKGIESSLGLVFSNNRESDSYILSESFSGFLLFIPSANKGTGEWLDFSGKDMQKGVVSKSYEVKNILLINDNTIKIQKVFSPKSVP